MPLFDYKCTECNQTNEHLVIKTEPTVCPACGVEHKLEKQLAGSVGFHFINGGGCYKNGTFNASKRGGKDL